MQPKHEHSLLLLLRCFVHFLFTKLLLLWLLLKEHLFEHKLNKFTRRSRMCRMQRFFTSHRLCWHGVGRETENEGNYVLVFGYIMQTNLKGSTSTTFIHTNRGSMPSIVFRGHFVISLLHSTQAHPASQQHENHRLIVT